MVQTRSSVKRKESGQAHNDDGTIAEGARVEHPPGNCVPPPVKKRRINKAAPKSRGRGKPGEICQLNLDVLFLIATFSQPMDLLNLARTCKSLRQLLMNKSSAFVWRTARSQVNGLPDCPADLAEPEYANLVFSARCHVCGKYAKTVLWEMRRRYCSKCRIGRFRSLISCHKVIRRNNVLATERITIKHETARWVDKEQLESFMHEYQHCSDEEQFLKDREEQFGAISMHARQCEKWQKEPAWSRRRCRFMCTKKFRELTP